MTSVLQYSLSEHRQNLAAGHADIAHTSRFISLLRTITAQYVHFIKMRLSFVTCVSMAAIVSIVPCDLWCKVRAYQH